MRKRKNIILERVAVDDYAAGGRSLAKVDGKVIFISGYAEEAFKKNLPEGERFVFLPKPFSLKDLVAAVKDTMAS